MSDSTQQPGPWISAVPGVRRRTLSVADRVMQVAVEFEPNAITAEHSHVHEQVIFVAAGEVILTVEGRERTLRAGESYALKSNVKHGARATSAGATLIDTFTPLREDFLEQDRAAAVRA